MATGPKAALEKLEQDLKRRDIDFQRIQIDIAAHSRMLDPILEDFRTYLKSIDLKPPQIPFASNRTGEIISPEQATDPDYWVNHLRGTVLFADCMSTLAAKNRIFIEVGPGKALSSLAGQHPEIEANQVIGTLRHPQDETPDDAYFLAMLGRVWALGGEIDWAQYWGEARRVRLPLPTYAFRRSHYFIEPGKVESEVDSKWLMRDETPENWGWAPARRPAYAACETDVTGDLSNLSPQRWLIFEDDGGLCDGVTERLRSAGHEVITVRAGDTFARDGEAGYILSPERGRESYDALIGDLMDREFLPDRVVHGWLATTRESHRPGSSFFHRNTEQGFFSLLFWPKPSATKAGSFLACDCPEFRGGASPRRGAALSGEGDARGAGSGDRAGVSADDGLVARSRPAAGEGSGHARPVVLHDPRAGRDPVAAGGVGGGRARAEAL